MVNFQSDFVTSESLLKAEFVNSCHNVTVCVFFGSRWLDTTAWWTWCFYMTNSVVHCLVCFYTYIT